MGRGWKGTGWLPGNWLGSHPAQAWAYSFHPRPISAYPSVKIYHSGCGAAQAGPAPAGTIILRYYSIRHSRTVVNGALAALYKNGQPHGIEILPQQIEKMPHGIEILLHQIEISRASVFTRNDFKEYALDKISCPIWIRCRQSVGLGPNLAVMKSSSASALPMAAVRSSARCRASSMRLNTVHRRPRGTPRRAWSSRSVPRPLR